MKVFVDGIPEADGSFAAVDPASIARVEVIRGPQAAAIYGSDAVGGVIQIFTKRGDSTLTRPQVDGEVALGVIQTPYAGYGSVIRQSYRGSVQGGGPGMSYQFGAGYTHTPDWVQPVTSQSNPSVHGGVHVARGILTADVSGRYFIENTSDAVDPAAAQTGFSSFTKPVYRPIQRTHPTLGARLTVAPTRWWQHSVTLGVDRLSEDVTQTQPRLTSPSDTFLTLSHQEQAKASIGYNTSVRGMLAAGITGSLTVGVDHYSLASTEWSTSGALVATGSITTDPTQPVSATRTIINNTGYFTQGQLALRDALFLTGGVRAEQNTNFGDSLGTPVSPQVGLSYTHDLGGATVKFRGSWGRAIRPPRQGQKEMQPGVGGQRANPLLAPERQRGWDTGLDAVFGSRGSLSVTYYNQTAEDLIALVVVPDAPVLTYQNQNVGRVKNSGVEVEGSVFAGPLQLRAQYGYAHSRIEDPGPASAGEFVAGDQILSTPTHTAGGSLTVTPITGTTIAAAVTYVGAYPGYDLAALFSCFAGTGPCRPGPGFRSYVSARPSFVKLNATVSQRVTHFVSGFVSVDNLTNNTAHEFTSFAAVMGRITTLGLHFQY